jgi:hypothetical protein
MAASHLRSLSTMPIHAHSCPRPSGRRAAHIHYRRAARAARMGLRSQPCAGKVPVCAMILPRNSAHPCVIGSTSSSTPTPTPPPSFPPSVLARQRRRSSNLCEMRHIPRRVKAENMQRETSRIGGVAGHDWREKTDDDGLKLEPYGATIPWLWDPSFRPNTYIVRARVH